MSGKDGTGLLHSDLGTKIYKAPEISFGQYRGDQTDVFAMGVILFIIYSGFPPFKESNIADSWYSKIHQKKYKEFWESHE